MLSAELNISGFLAEAGSSLGKAPRGAKGPSKQRELCIAQPGDFEFCKEADRLVLPLCCARVQQGPEGGTNTTVDLEHCPSVAERFCAPMD